MPAPLIEYAQFAHPQQWWLRRGPPPWLDDLRWFARAFRLSLILGLMGTVTGWLTVGFLFLLATLETYDLPSGISSIWELSLFVGPGVCFGLGVLVPLSRWVGRGWIMTVLAVPVSMAANFAAIMLYLVVDPPMGTTPDWIPGGESAAGFVAGFAGAAIIAVWMGHPLRRSAWLAGFVASLLASMSCGCFFAFPELESSNLLPNEITSFLSTGWLFVGFQSLTAVGLGLRLWGPNAVKGTDVAAAPFRRESL